MQGFARSVHLAGQRLRRRPDKCDAGRRPSGRRIPRPAASGRTRSLSLVLFPPKPLRWVSAGALLGEVIKLPFCIFSALLCRGDITTLWPLWLCRNNPVRGLFQQKKRLSQSGCSVPTDTLFPPAHSAFSALLCGGWYHYPRRALHAVETLDARGSRRRIRRFYAAAVLALCGLYIPSAGTQRHPSPEPRTQRLTGRNTGRSHRLRHRQGR